MFSITSKLDVNAGGHEYHSLGYFPEHLCYRETPFH